MQPIAYADFEVYSEAGYDWKDDTQRWGPLPGATKPGLPAIGVAKYVEHPSTLPLTLSYAFGPGVVNTWRVTDALDPHDLFEHVERGGLLSGWNVSYEWRVWNEICVPRWGWPVLPIRQCRCTMGRARAHALPGALGKCAEVLGMPIQKADSKWMKRFCMPRNPTKADDRRRITPSDDPAGFEELVRYNVTDVEAERAIAQRIPELSADELEYWFCDFEMNARGVQIDVAGVDACIKVVDDVLAKADAEMHALTGGAVERTSQLERLKDWMALHGVVTPSLDEDVIAELLKARLTPAVRRALELRQIAGSASVKKVYAMRNQVTSKGRLHNMWLYHAARTGRPTGTGPQPTNLPNSGPDVYQCRACGHWHGTHTLVCPWCAAVRGPDAKAQEWNPAAAEDALRVIGTGGVEWFFGHALNTVSGCLRALFIAAPGHELVSSDYNSIEAVVAACLAGEQWRIDVFRTHGRIYEVSAAKITGIPFDEATVHPHRKRGKVAELASGYQGWVSSWLAFGAGEFMGEDEIKQAILAWRAESPAIVHLWGAIQNAAHWAVMSPTIPFHVMRLDGSFSGLSYCYEADDVLYCTLPSGRPLSYHRPRLASRERYGRTEQSLSYEGWNSNPKNGPTGWIRMDTWGGRFFENNCQAVAGDVQRYSIITAERNNYAVVMNVYDEQACEVPKGVGRVSTLEQFMGDLPEWCRDWPIRASGGWVGERYR